MRIEEGNDEDGDLTANGPVFAQMLRPGTREWTGLRSELGPGTREFDTGKGGDRHGFLTAEKTRNATTESGN